MLWLIMQSRNSTLSWANKCQIDYDEKFQQLEDLKSYFKLTTVLARNEREFKATAINQTCMGHATGKKWTDINRCCAR